MAFDGEVQEPVQEFRERHAAGFPQLRVHADLGEAGDGVDLVDQQVGLFLRRGGRAKKKVDARHPFHLQHFAHPARQVARPLLFGGGQRRGDQQLGAIGIEVLGGVAVEFVCLPGDDLARQ